MRAFKGGRRGEMHESGARCVYAGNVAHMSPTTFLGVEVGHKQGFPM